jgi:hypothetical protein
LLQLDDTNGNLEQIKSVSCFKSGVCVNSVVLELFKFYQFFSVKLIIN